MQLEDLRVYTLACQLSMKSWEIYSILHWQIKKIMGDQFITAVDSVGANIAEGWGRFHFLDKNKFNYNARASLVEASYWLHLLNERKLISPEKYFALKKEIEVLHFKLNNYIRVTRQQV